MAGSSNFARCCMIVIEVFTLIMQELLQFYEENPKSIYRRALDDKMFKRIMTQTEFQTIKTLCSDGFTKLDFTLAYKLTKFFRLIPQPTRDWGAKPSQDEKEIGDDVERIRYRRNSIVHSIKFEYTDIEMHSFFTEIISVGERVDRFLGKKKFQQQIISSQTFVLDENLEGKYIAAIKEIEKLEEKLKAIVNDKVVRIYYGTTMDEVIQDIRKMSEHAARDVGTSQEWIPVQFRIHGIMNADQKAEILRSLASEINDELIHIKFKDATEGSLIIFADIKSSAFENEIQITREIANFIQRIFRIGNIMLEDEFIDIVLNQDEDIRKNCYDEEFAHTSSEHEVNTLVLDLEMQDSVFLSDDLMKKEIGGFFETIMKKANGGDIFQNQETIAIMQPSETEILKETFHSTDKTARCRSLKDQDLGTLSKRHDRPEVATENLRIIFELLEKFLNMKEFDQDLRNELYTAYPDYMTVLQSSKRDLLRNDCGIVVAGETSAGKTTLINKITGHKVFVTSNLAATARVCRIRNSDTIMIKAYTKDEVKILEKTFQDTKELKSMIKTLTDKSKIPDHEKEILYVDVFLPVRILKGNIIIVDTPGVGESADLNQILMDFLPHAVSFLFIVNANNAGGIHEAGLGGILKAVMENREKMPCFDPREVIFVTNKWDAIQNEESSDEEEEDELTKTWKLILDKLQRGWAWVNTDRIFKVSLKQVEKGKGGEFTEDYSRFEACLHETIDNNKNKRVYFYFRFLENFVHNAERGTRARLHLLEMSEEEQKAKIHKNRQKIKELKKDCAQSRDVLELYKRDVIQKLADKLYVYLHSSKGKDEILNPQFEQRIEDVSLNSLNKVIPERIQKGIQRWCEGQEVKRIIEDAEEKIRSLVSDIETKLQAIETDLTGVNFQQETGGAAAGVLLLGLGVLFFLPFSIVFTFVFALIMTPFVAVWGWWIGQEGRRQRASEMYDTCLEQISKEELCKSFEQSFGEEFSKVIVKIFDDSIPKVLKSCIETNEKLLKEQQSIRQRRDEFMNLKKMIDQIEEKMQKFRKTADVSA